MLCNLVWKYMVWLSRNLLDSFLLPPFIPTLMYEEAFQQLGGPAMLKWFPWTVLQGDDAQGCFSQVFLPPHSSLEKGEGKSQRHCEIWSCGLFWGAMSILQYFLRFIRSSAFWREYWGLASILQRAVPSEALLSMILSFSISCLRSSLGA